MMYSKSTPQPRVLVTLFAVLFSSTVLAEKIDSRYEFAIRDSAVMKASNERTLTPLTNGTERFVVWTDYPGYQPNDHYFMPLNLFVSRESEMKAACRRLAIIPSPMLLKGNINQLLGLPLMDASQKFVQITMNVDQPNNATLANYSDSTLGQALFRPCNNPNVHSDSCGTDFANDVTDDFKLWIYQKTKQAYHESTVDRASGKFRYGYPWTDLGYTYNWGSRNHFGLQEFVMKKGAEVKVVKQANGTAYRTAMDFCRSVN